MKITAQYDVNLPAFLFLRLDENQSRKIYLTFQVDDYDLEIHLILDTRVGHQSKGDSHLTYGVSHLIVRVTHDEQGDLDSIKSRRIELCYPFEEIAEIAINRLIRFFKYKLNNPLLREVNAHDDSWSTDSKWYDSEGNEFDLRVSSSDTARHLAYGYFPRFGMKALCDINDPNLRKALQNPLSPHLYEEFLNDARTEIIEENYKRAVIEMAIACEVFVKSIFFSASPISGAVFDYLASQRKIEVSIHELIDKPAKEAFGESFKDKSLNDYKNIGYLFQARNRVVHAGQCAYKDDKSKKREIDRFVLEDWWQSVDALIDWLKAKDQYSANSTEVMN